VCLNSYIIAFTTALTWMLSCAADLGAPPDPYFDVDVDAMERQAVSQRPIRTRIVQASDPVPPFAGSPKAELEKANAEFEKQSEARLREAKRRFESLTNGVAVE
jgi:hypothetical protein